MLVGMWRNWNLCTAGRNVKWCVAAKENTMVVAEKIQNRITIQSRNTTFGYMPKITEGRVSKRYLYTHVQSSIIHIA